MISAFVDKATGLLNRQFILAYWLPSLIAFILILMFNAIFWGAGPAHVWWQQIQCFITSSPMCNANLQLNVLLYIIAGVTILAYIMQIFANQIVRFYEGYWSHFPLDMLSKIGITKYQERMKKINSERELPTNIGNVSLQNSLQRQLYTEYPCDETLIMPTKIGNILRSAELYSTESYGMDSAFWWPRLWPILPDNFKNQINDSLTPMLALLIFSMLLPAFTVLGWIYIFYQKIGSTFTPLSFIGISSLLFMICILISWISYHAATTQAINYGMNVRAAVDLYRLDLLKALHVTLPNTLDEEVDIWENLYKWLYAKDRLVAPNYGNLR